MEEKEKNNIKEIDLVEIFSKLWTSRRLYIRVLGIVFVLTCILVLSIPRTYSTSVTLAPESDNSSSLSGSMSSIASMMGVRVGTSDDAIYPELYPNILESSPFLLDMFDVHIESGEKNISTTYYDYMLKHQKHPWWYYIISPIKKFIKKIFGKTPTGTDATPLNPFFLTKEEKAIMEIIKKTISCSVDKKTEVITIVASDQDPYISACLADTVCRKLQEYIVRYRTNKSRNDYEYMDKLYQVAKQEYLEAQEKYARFADSNQSLIFTESKAQGDLLENEMNMAFNAYQQISEQLQLARAKVQESTPAFTVIQPAVVPLKPSAPRRMLIVLGTMIVAFAVTSGWVLLKK